MRHLRSGSLAATGAHGMKTSKPYPGRREISSTGFESSRHRDDAPYRLLEIAKQSRFLDDGCAALFDLFAIESRHDDPAVILAAGKRLIVWG
jgi:hypothetical protein